MKLIKKGIIAGVLVLGGIGLIINSNLFISNQTWKYRDGFHIGDWVDFKSTNMTLKGSSIIKKDEEIAKVNFCLGKMLVIKDIKTGEVWHYINK